jgi:hypothetical protein
MTIRLGSTKKEGNSDHWEMKEAKAKKSKE